MSNSVSEETSNYGRFSFRQENRLGEGFCGTTYRALDAITNCDVALKIIKPEHEWYNIESFRRDVYPLISDLRHPNIIKYIACDFRQEKNATTWYIVTELANQGTLEARIHNLSYFQGIDYVIQMLAALEAAHKNGVLHNDLKPDNIFLHNGVIKVGDFGTCRESNKTIIVSDPAGKTLYAAPERYSKDKLSKRTDLWSVAVMLYEITYRYLPFATKLLIEDPQYNPDFQETFGLPDLKNVLRKALRKDETKRYQTSRDFSNALKQLLTIRIDNIMNIEKGVVGWNWDGTGYDYREFPIVFLKPFKTAPVIQTSIQKLDTAPDADKNIRYWVCADEINATGAKIKVGTWETNKLFGCEISWLALGD